MTKNQIKSVSVIGLGLIGTSLARALQAASLEQSQKLSISGYDNNFSVKEKKEILDYGIDRFETDFQFLCSSDLLLLAAPVEENIKVIKKIKRFLKPKTLVVDVSSTKVAIMEAAKELQIPFVGLHPIAGSEQRGYQNSNPAIFKGRPFIVCGDKKTLNQPKVKDLLKLIKGTGAKTLTMSPQEHDAVFARVSHLPQLISTTLINFCEDDLERAGAGFSDVTRLSGSAWSVWRDILTTNTEEVASSLDVFADELKSLSKAVRGGEEEKLERLFERANKNHKKLQKLMPK
ncbi:MAG: prephenate dehydrogenase/arogenate dehydrogenase family protein [Chlorobiales bacterium]|nr:prephenate dehydrogenase/arogenate dehydrogenase family protein [Chlorobiales bacterium]